MKKILALLMAVMMILTAVSALAAGSPDTKPVVVPTEQTEAIEPVIIILDDQSSAEELAAQMSAAEYDASVLTAETQEAIADVKDLVASELVALKATKAEEAVIATFDFATDYTVDQTVVTVLKIEDTELVLKNTVNEDGTVAILFTVDALSALMSNDGILIVLSK